jgi:hypothetical protein
MKTGFPFYYVGELAAYYDARRGGKLMQLAAAAKRLSQYMPDEYGTDLSARIALEQAALVPITMAQVSELKRKTSGELDWQQVYEEMQSMFPFYSHLNANGERQIYFANALNELTPVSYKDDDSLINSIMYNKEIWTNISKFYTNTELLAGHRSKVDLRTFLIRIIKCHLLLDREHCIFEQPKRFSWKPEELAFKKFDPSVLKDGPTPTWDEFLNRLDYPEVFKAWVWSVFDPDNNIRQVMWLTGSGNDGKSAIQKALLEIFGRDNSAACQKGDEFAKWFGKKVYGKGFVTYADCDNIHLLNSQAIKQLTGGDITSIEAKGVDSFSAEIYAKLLISSNMPPRINPELEAHTSRLIRLKVAPIAAGQPKDEQFKTRLIAEGYAFLCKCREAYDKYINNGQDALILPEELTKGIIDECANETYYLLLEFVDKYIEFGENYYCKPSALSPKLKEFLTLENYIAADKARYFMSDFDAKLGLKGVKLSRVEVGRNKFTAYVGFRFKDSKDSL